MLQKNGGAPARPGLISVIVPTYNRPDALAAVLAGLQSQDDERFETIVADDGSDYVTRDLAKYARVKHVWHEHRGFRLAEIRNRAILASAGDYCVFLDGDSIPRRSFVAAHRRIAEPGYYVVGNRVMLRQKMTERVLANPTSMLPHDWPLPIWLWLRLAHKINRIAPMVSLPLGPLRRRVRQTWKRAMGCNFAVWRGDLDRVNGFDQSFVGWGWEDNDMFLRLLNAGVKRKTGRFATGVIHLWHHPVYSEPNRLLFENTLATNRVLARQGLTLHDLIHDEGGVASSTATRASNRSILVGPGAGGGGGASATTLLDDHR